MKKLPFDLTPAQHRVLIAQGICQFAGHQVVRFGDAWRIATGYEFRDLDSYEVNFLKWLLEELGYDQAWVIEPERSQFHHRWVRGPWPNDFMANKHRTVEHYVLP